MYISVQYKIMSKTFGKPMAVKTRNGIPSVQAMLENTRRKFIGNLLNDEIFTVVFSCYDI